MIKSGRNGAVKWDPTATTPVLIASLNGWTLSMKTDKIDVTCFGDQNKVYVPGLRDISGTIKGFWNSDELSLIEATELTAPGMLELVPDTTDAAAATMLFKGLAYLDAEIDTTVDGAPELSSEILAAGPWTMPTAGVDLLTRGGDRGRRAAA